MKILKRKRWGLNLTIEIHNPDEKIKKCVIRDEFGYRGFTYLQSNYNLVEKCLNVYLADNEEKRNIQRAPS